MVTVSVSEFKATCLELLSEVQRTGEPILITKRGKPLAQVTAPPPLKLKNNGVGCMKGTVHIHGDIVAPALDPSEYGDGDWSNVKKMFDPPDAK
jgi:prevent-host-death family protein